jgi:hypothetical protein
MRQLNREDDAMLPFPPGWIEREYVALCIAEQIVRSVTAAVHVPEAATGARRATGGDLLVGLAESLDMRERVAALVVEALGHDR